jgi:hypothetical protein
VLSASGVEGCAGVVVPEGWAGSGGDERHRDRLPGGVEKLSRLVDRLHECASENGARS